MQVDLLDGLGGGADFDAHGVADVRLDQVLDRAFDGGGEEQRLALGGRGRHDPFDGGQEAHIQHAVGFVQDQHADAAQVDELAAEKIVEPAGGGDQHLRALADGLQAAAASLMPPTTTAARIPVPAAILAKVFVDLEREFAGRAQDDGADAGARLAAAPAVG